MAAARHAAPAEQMRFLLRKYQPKALVMVAYGRNSYSGDPPGLWAWASDEGPAKGGNGEWRGSVWVGMGLCGWLGGWVCRCVGVHGDIKVLLTVFQKKKSYSDKNLKTRKEGLPCSMLMK
jgi:hypothetical protein